MALITPQLLSTAAFDATQDHAFVFIVTGGDQVVASRLIVKNKGTLEEVYNQQIQSRLIMPPGKHLRHLRPSSFIAIRRRLWSSAICRLAMLLQTAALHLR